MNPEEFCPTGKARHASANAARRQIRNLSQRPSFNRTRGTGSDGTKVEPYRCRDCGYWHIGRPSKYGR